MAFFEVRKLTEIYSLLKEWGKISLFKKKKSLINVGLILFRSHYTVHQPVVLSSISCYRSVQRLNGAGRLLLGNQHWLGDSIADEMQLPQVSFSIDQRILR